MNRAAHPFARRSADMDIWRGEPISVRRVLLGACLGGLAVYLLALITV